jgi:hypothetical protein
MELPRLADIVDAGNSSFVIQLEASRAELALTMATPQPGTMPTSTAARWQTGHLRPGVSLFELGLVAAPTRMMATPPDSLAGALCSFSRRNRWWSCRSRPGSADSALISFHRLYRRRWWCCLVSNTFSATAESESVRNPLAPGIFEITWRRQVASRPAALRVAKARAFTAGLEHRHAVVQHQGSQGLAIDIFRDDDQFTRLPDRTSFFQMGTISAAAEIYLSWIRIKASRMTDSICSKSVTK